MADEIFKDNTDAFLRKTEVQTDKAMREIGFNVESTVKQNIAGIDAIDYGILLNSVYLRFPDKNGRDAAQAAMQSKAGSKGRKSKSKLSPEDIKLAEPLQIVLKSGMLVLAVAAEYAADIEFGRGIGISAAGNAKVGNAASRLSDRKLVSFIPARPYVRPALELWKDRGTDVLKRYLESV